MNEQEKILKDFVNKIDFIIKSYYLDKRNKVNYFNKLQLLELEIIKASKKDRLLKKYICQFDKNYNSKFFAFMYLETILNKDENCFGQNISYLESL